ncbi:protein ninF, partial [Salmonella enterica]|nr:protein ninF [Salmonella enterica]MFI12472.1 protein ninF [Salmonella enterica]
MLSPTQIMQYQKESVDRAL